MKLKTVCVGDCLPVQDGVGRMYNSLLNQDLTEMPIPYAVMRKDGKYILPTGNDPAAAKVDRGATKLNLRVLESDAEVEEVAVRLGGFLAGINTLDGVINKYDLEARPCCEERGIASIADLSRTSFGSRSGGSSGRVGRIGPSVWSSGRG